MEGYLNQFMALADGAKLSVLFALILANFLIGTAVSMYKGEFRLMAVADFMAKRVLPYVLAYFGVVMVALVEPSWEGIVTAVWAILLAALVGHILGNLRKLGIPLPDFLAGKKE